MIRFFNPGKGYAKIEKEIDSEIKRVLTFGDLILREDVDLFEKNLAEFVGTEYAVALNSGTDALLLSLMALGFNKESKIAVPSHTFVATPQVVNQVGAEVVLYDMDGKTEDEGMIDAYMVAHIAGELSPIPDYKVPIIEDACQALGAVKNPTSEAQCWSFYPAKILGAYGDAGALTTNSKHIYNEVKELRNHYKKDYSKWGINSRMDNMQAAILNVKMKYLPAALARRKEVAEEYLKGLYGVVGLPNNTPGRVWQDFVIQCKNRDGLYEFLKEKGIETMKNEYPFPIQKMPKSIAYEASTLRIPCNENLENSEVQEVIARISEYENV